VVDVYRGDDVNWGLINYMDIQLVILC